jgi:F-type H+-transporting ATPase subunit delta
VQEKATIARPYARAAFEQAREERKLKEWSAMLELLAAVASDSLMKSVIKNPKVSPEQLYAVVTDVCGKVLSESGRNFAKVLVNAGRLDVAPEIREQFEQKRARAEGVSEVRVITAYELDAAQQQRIAEAMKKRLGRDIEMSAEVDKSIIGGVIIRAGDSVIDASLRGRLRQLANEFAK